MMISIAQAQLFLLAMTRILAIMIQVPVLGGNTIPTQVRIALGVVLTAILIPWQPLSASADALPILGLAMAIGRELLIGTLTGFAATLTFNVLQITAEMISLGSGFSAGRILNPTLGDSGSAINNFFVIVAVLMFLVMNGHHMVIIAMQRTFTLLPVNKPLPELAGDKLILLSSQLIGSGIQISLPVVGALLMADLTLGLLSRVAPQIQVFFLGLPMKIGLTFIGISLFLMVVMPILSEMFQSIGPRMLRMVGG